MSSAGKSSWSEKVKKEKSRHKKMEKNHILLPYSGGNNLSSSIYYRLHQLMLDFEANPFELNEIQRHPFENFPKIMKKMLGKGF